MQFAIYNPTRSGFTLLELIVVIFILSVFMGLVMPVFYGVGEGRLNSEAGKMISILRYLNDSAVSRKETFPLTISLDTGTVRWKTHEGEKSEKLAGLFSVSTTSTGNVSKGEVTLFFGPLGLQENLLITLKDRDKEMLVSFNSLSGRAKVIQDSK